MEPFGRRGVWNPWAKGEFRQLSLSTSFPYGSSTSVFWKYVATIWKKTAATLKPADNLNLGNNVTDTKTMLMD